MNLQPDFEQKYSTLIDENARLQTVIGELSILNDIAIAISSSQTIEQIERLIIKKLTKHIYAEDGVVMLLNDFDLSRPFQTMMRTNNSILGTVSHKLDEQIMGWMLVNKSPLMINNFFEDTRFSIKEKGEEPIRSILCSPLMIKSNLIGLIALFNKNKGEFTENDQRLLSICAVQSAQVLESARLYQQETALNKLREEMSLARQIQKNLLPVSDLKIDGYSIAGNMISAKEVGGDFYNFIPLSNNRIAVWLGDISGKGIPAALLMANLEGILRTRSLIDLNCSKCLSNANENLIICSESDKFATLFYSILDLSSNQIIFSSAGHTSLILLKHTEEVKFFKSVDIPLGIYSNYEYSETQIELEKNDTLIIYSDGIIEAENEKEELFGEERLLKAITADKNLSSRQLVNHIYNSVQKFSGSTPQSDDQTILIIKRE